MPFPGGVSMVTIVGGPFLELEGGTPASGSVVFELQAPVRVVASPTVIIASRFVATLDATGSFSIQLPATDSADLSPIPYYYRVIEDISNLEVTLPFFISLPAATTPVNYDDLIVFAGVPPIDSDQRIYVVKPSDQTLNNVGTLTNDSVLSQQIASGYTYRIEGELFYSSAIANGLKIKFADPSSAVGLFSWSSTGIPYSVASNALGTTVTLDGAASDLSVKIDSFITSNGTTGVVHLQWAQATPTVANTILRKGSWLMLERMA